MADQSVGAPERSEVKRGRPSHADIMEHGTAEQRQGLIKKKLGKMSAEEIDALERTVLAQYAALEDSPESFAAFYKVIHGKEMPDHAYREWVSALYEAREQGKGLVVEAFRGSTKTTTVTITFVAYRIGKEPHKSNLLVQVGDDIAQDNTSAIADIIANNPGWKLVFKDVVPDTEKGWGAGGYEVKRTDMDYEQWRMLNTDRKDPTLVGVGYKSREIIGKHPNGMCVIDDIHDENNTSSARELETVIRIVTGTIFPAMTKETWRIFIGTPWTDTDVLHYVSSTGEYNHVKTPAERVNEEGERVAVWGEVFDLAELDKIRRLTGSLEYARMYMLDLTHAKNRVLKYMTYPNSEIRFNWPMVGGTDYASNRDAARNASGKGDYFALCYLAKLPGSGAVVVDGVIDRCTQAQGEAYMLRAQEIYPMWMKNGVESIGKGDDFFQVLMRNPLLRVIPLTPGGRGKAERIERELSPWLENGTIRISDANTPFLNELRRELDAWPNVDHDDAIDALYYAMRMMPEVFIMPEMSNEVREVVKRKRANNPFLAFGRS